MTDTLDAGRRKARRNWARAAFYLLMVEGAAILSLLLFSPARGEIAAALAAAASILIGFFSFQTMLVCVYLGVSLADSWRRQQQ